MSKRLFGTDGIRGVAGQTPLDPATITALGMALGTDFIRHDLQAKPVLIGMDTRESGPGIAAQLAQGLGRKGLKFGLPVWSLRQAWLTSPAPATLPRES